MTDKYLFLTAVADFLHKAATVLADDMFITIFASRIPGWQHGKQTVSGSLKS